MQFVCAGHLHPARLVRKEPCAPPPCLLTCHAVQSGAWRLPSIQVARGGGGRRRTAAEA